MDCYASELRCAFVKTCFGCLLSPFMFSFIVIIHLALPFHPSPLPPLQLYIWSGSEELTLFAGFSDHESAPVGSIDSISSSNNIVLFVNTNPAYLKTLQK